MKYGILLAMGMIAATALVGADRAVNAFLAVDGDGVSIDDDGSIVCDRSAAGSVTVSARPGWLVNGRESVSVDPKRGSGLKVTSKLGEDEEHVHVFPQTVEDDHFEDIVLVAEATPASQIAMYALPDTSIVVSASATHKVDKCGKHKVTTTYYPCECGETHAPQESVSTYEVEPDHYEWTASGAGQTVESSTWTGQMSKGLRQSISFHVTGKRDECVACTCTASTNVFVDVHELSVTNGLYLGLDRTDCGRTNPVVKVAGAIIDPEPTGSSAYLWTDCGICSFTGRTDRAQVRYFAPDPDKGSAHHLAERLTVAATVTNECGSTASATCTTNFTVVAVDVTIGSVGENKEEKEGAFVQYVPDTNGVIGVEGTNKMVEVKFTCNPTNLPANEMVTVSHTGQGELYEVLQSGELLKVTSATYPACEIANRKFKLHGHSPSMNIRDGKIEIRHSSSSAKDMANYSVVLVDLDVDSDNDLKIEGEDKCFEDLIEDDTSKPGKALYLNELDQDKDGIPDWADGYDSNPVFGNQSAADASGTFAQMRLRALSPSSDAVIKFSCADADSDAQVTRTGSGTKASPYVYQGCGKKIRIWTKDGKAARSRGGFPVGDLIKMDTPYKATDLLNGGNRMLYVEAVGGSAAIGDVEISATLYPDGEGRGSTKDVVRMTVFHVETVHPVAADFKSGHVGKVMISTKQDVPGPDRYYTDAITTTSGKAAQTEEAAVTVSAYIVPVPIAPIPNLKLRFELTDPDDLSHYEGKAVAGTPNVQGDENPNDNNDPRKRKIWNSGVPSGYDSYQRCLSQSEVVPLLASIAGMRRYVAESRLEITDRYSGDNYCVRATLADPERKPFDTLSGMTAGAPVSKSIINYSETLIAWKRVYIEQDEMYKSGCTVTRAFTPTAGASTSTLEVDSTTDFSIGDCVVAFWAGGSVPNVTVVGKTANMLTVSGLGVPVPKYGGFRIVGRDDVYTVDRRFLPNAYGSAPDGSDGGAFIEFKLLDSVRNPNARVPKYNRIPDGQIALEFFNYWFDNKSQLTSNVLCLAIAYDVAYRQNYSLYGLTWNNYSISSVYFRQATSIQQVNDTVAHEIGHRLGLRNASGGNFSHIDNNLNQLAHDGGDRCLMSYDRNRSDGNVEFCSNCLLFGTAFQNNDSLRGQRDE